MFLTLLNLKKKILVVGSIPPPYHGCSVMNNYLLSSHLTKQFNIIFLDISDRRGIKNLGVLDIKNIYFAFYHGLNFIYYLFYYNPDLIYISISQVFWGYIRDLIFLFSSRFIDKKILIHLHGGAFHEFYQSMPWLLAKLTRYIFRGRIWGIVLDESLKTCFDGLIKSEKIYCVPNGIKDISIHRNPNQARMEQFIFFTYQI